ncbi:CidA/LrgA family protein [Defluviimonas sp. WL0002]|uniref:CidA/LrgA family protein n=1 Tax=Albidovulum marisflavi TaxID=2984159 RepID=A0ABT2ZBF4_9RHOB|nr:CidA/LrgA family protein [Defluviimonas sp. WL0002]MCV2868469.1 CidA/LrgA family protein [Defluviimonas sp. WL0002]
MPQALLVLLLCQLAGEAIARLIPAPLPGPVFGMLLMLGLFAASRRFVDFMRPLAEGILANLSLLFVPAGVGVVGHIATLGTQAATLIVAVVISTMLAIAAGAAVFVAVARMTGATDD